LRLADLEVTKSLPHELVSRVDPVILTVLRRSPGPVARKCVKPLCVLLEELGIVPRGGNLDVVVRDKPVNNSLTCWATSYSFRALLQFLQELKLDHHMDN
jgi:hypothetical protein